MRRLRRNVKTAPKKTGTSAARPSSQASRYSTKSTAAAVVTTVASPISITANGADQLLRRQHKVIHQAHVGLTCAPLSSSARHFSHADTPDSSNGAGGGVNTEVGVGGSQQELSGFGGYAVVGNEVDEYIADGRSAEPFGGSHGYGLGVGVGERGRWGAEEGDGGQRGHFFGAATDSSEIEAMYGHDGFPIDSSTAARSRHYAEEEEGHDEGIDEDGGGRINSRDGGEGMEEDPFADAAHLSQNSIVAAQYYATLPLDASAVSLERAYNVCLAAPSGKALEQYKAELAEALAREFFGKSSRNRTANKIDENVAELLDEGSEVAATADAADDSSFEQKRQQQQEEGEEGGAYNEQQYRALLEAVDAMTPLSAIPLTVRLLSTRILSRERWDNALFVGPRPVIGASPSAAAAVLSATAGAAAAASGAATAAANPHHHRSHAASAEEQPINPSAGRDLFHFADNEITVNNNKTTATSPLSDSELKSLLSDDVGEGEKGVEEIITEEEEARRLVEAGAQKRGGFSFQPSRNIDEEYNEQYGQSRTTGEAESEERILDEIISSAGRSSLPFSTVSSSAVGGGGFLAAMAGSGNSAAAQQYPGGNRLFTSMVVPSCQEHSRLSGPDRGRHALQIPIASPLRPVRHRSLAAVAGPNALRYAPSRSLLPLHSHLDAKSDECYSWGFGHESIVSSAATAAAASAVGRAGQNTPANNHHNGSSDNRQGLPAKEPDTDELELLETDDAAASTEKAAPTEKGTVSSATADATDPSNYNRADSSNTVATASPQPLPPFVTRREAAALRDALHPSAVRTVARLMADADIPKRGSCGAPNLINSYGCPEDAALGADPLVAAMLEEGEGKVGNPAHSSSSSSSVAALADAQRLLLAAGGPAAAPGATSQLSSPTVAAVAAYANVLTSLGEHSRRAAGESEPLKTDDVAKASTSANNNSNNSGSQSSSSAAPPLVATKQQQPVAPSLTDQLYRAWLWDYCGPSQAEAKAGAINALVVTAGGGDKGGSGENTAVVMASTAGSSQLQQLLPSSDAALASTVSSIAAPHHHHHAAASALEALVPHITRDWESGLNFLKFLGRCEGGLRSGGGGGFGGGRGHHNDDGGGSAASNAAAHISAAAGALRDREEALASKREADAFAAAVRKRLLQSRRGAGVGAGVGVGVGVGGTEGGGEASSKAPLFTFVTGANGRRYAVRRAGFKSIEGRWPLLEEGYGYVKAASSSSSGARGNGSGSRGAHHLGLSAKPLTAGGNSRRYLRARLSRWDNRSLRPATLMNRFLFARGAAKELAAIPSAQRDGGGDRLVRRSTILDSDVHSGVTLSVSGEGGGRGGGGADLSANSSIEGARGGVVSIYTHYRAAPPMPPPMLSPALVDGLEALAIDAESVGGARHTFRAVCAATGAQQWWRFGAMSAPTAAADPRTDAAALPIVIEMKRGVALNAISNDGISSTLLLPTGAASPTLALPLSSAAAAAGFSSAAPLASVASGGGSSESITTTNAAVAATTAGANNSNGNNLSVQSQQQHLSPTVADGTRDVKRIVVTAIVPKVMALCAAAGRHSDAVRLFDQHLARADVVPPLAALSLAVAVGGKRRSWFMAPQLLDLLSTRADLDSLPPIPTSSSDGDDSKNALLAAAKNAEASRRLFVAKYLGVVLNTFVEAGHWEEGLSFVRSVGGVRQLAFDRPAMVALLKLFLITPPSVMTAVVVAPADANDEGSNDNNNNKSSSAANIDAGRDILGNYVPLAAIADPSANVPQYIVCLAAFEKAAVAAGRVFASEAEAAAAAAELLLRCDDPFAFGEEAEEVSSAEADPAEGQTAKRIMTTKKNPESATAKKPQQQQQQKASAPTTMMGAIEAAFGEEAAALYGALKLLYCDVPVPAWYRRGTVGGDATAIASALPASAHGPLRCPVLGVSSFSSSPPLLGASLYHPILALGDGSSSNNTSQQQQQKFSNKEAATKRRSRGEREKEEGTANNKTTSSSSPPSSPPPLFSTSEKETMASHKQRLDRLLSSSLLALDACARHGLFRRAIRIVDDYHALLQPRLDVRKMVVVAPSIEDALRRANGNSATSATNTNSNGNSNSEDSTSASAATTYVGGGGGGGPPLRPEDEDTSAQHISDAVAAFVFESVLRANRYDLPLAALPELFTALIRLLGFAFDIPILSSNSTNNNNNNKSREGDRDRRSNNSSEQLELPPMGDLTAYFPSSAATTTTDGIAASTSAASATVVPANITAASLAAAVGRSVVPILSRHHHAVLIGAATAPAPVGLETADAEDEGRESAKKERVVAVLGLVGNCQHYFTRVLERREKLHNFFINFATEHGFGHIALEHGCRPLAQFYSVFHPNITAFHPTDAHWRSFVEDCRVRYDKETAAITAELKRRFINGAAAEHGNNSNSKSAKDDSPLVETGNGNGSGGTTSLTRKDIAAFAAARSAYSSTYIEVALARLRQRLQTVEHLFAETQLPQMVFEDRGLVPATSSSSPCSDTPSPSRRDGGGSDERRGRDYRRDDDRGRERGERRRDGDREREREREREHDRDRRRDVASNTATAKTMKTKTTTLIRPWQAFLALSRPTVCIGQHGTSSSTSTNASPLPTATGSGGLNVPFIRAGARNGASTFVPFWGASYAEGATTNIVPVPGCGRVSPASFALTNTLRTAKVPAPRLPHEQQRALYAENYKRWASVGALEADRRAAEEEEEEEGVAGVGVRRGGGSAGVGVAGAGTAKPLLPTVFDPQFTTESYVVPSQRAETSQTTALCEAVAESATLGAICPTPRTVTIRMAGEREGHSPSASASDMTITAHASPSSIRMRLGEGRDPLRLAGAVGIDRFLPSPRAFAEPMAAYEARLEREAKRLARLGADAPQRVATSVHVEPTFAAPIEVEIVKQLESRSVRAEARRLYEALKKSHAMMMMSSSTSSKRTSGSALPIRPNNNDSYSNGFGLASRGCGESQLSSNSSALLLASIAQPALPALCVPSDEYANNSNSNGGAASAAMAERLAVIVAELSEKEAVTRLTRALTLSRLTIATISATSESAPPPSSAPNLQRLSDPLPAAGYLPLGIVPQQHDRDRGRGEGDRSDRDRIRDREGDRGRDRNRDRSDRYSSPASSSPASSQSSAAAHSLTAACVTRTAAVQPPPRPSAQRLPPFEGLALAEAAERARARSSISVASSSPSASSSASAPPIVQQQRQQQQRREEESSRGTARREDKEIVLSTTDVAFGLPFHALSLAPAAASISNTKITTSSGGANNKNITSGTVSAAAASPHDCIVLRKLPNVTTAGTVRYFNLASQEVQFPRLSRVGFGKEQQQSKSSSGSGGGRGGDADALRWRPQPQHATHDAFAPSSISGNKYCSEDRHRNRGGSSSAEETASDTAAAATTVLKGFATSYRPLIVLPRYARGLLPVVPVHGGRSFGAGSYVTLRAVVSPLAGMAPIAAELTSRQLDAIAKRNRDSDPSSTPLLGLDMEAGGGALAAAGRVPLFGAGSSHVNATTAAIAAKKKKRSRSNDDDDEDDDDDDLPSVTANDVASDAFLRDCSAFAKVYNVALGGLVGASSGDIDGTLDLSSPSLLPPGAKIGGSGAAYYAGGGGEGGAVGLGLQLEATIRLERGALDGRTCLERFEQSLIECGWRIVGSPYAEEGIRGSLSGRKKHSDTTRKGGNGSGFEDRDGGRSGMGLGGEDEATPALHESDAGATYHYVCSEGSLRTAAGGENAAVERREQALIRSRLLPGSGGGGGYGSDSGSGEEEEGDGGALAAFGAAPLMITRVTFVCDVTCATRTVEICASSSALLGGGCDTDKKEVEGAARNGANSMASLLLLSAATNGSGGAQRPPGSASGNDSAAVFATAKAIHATTILHTSVVSAEP